MDSYHRLVSHQQRNLQELTPNETGFAPRVATVVVMAALLAWVLFFILR